MIRIRQSMLTFVLMTLVPSAQGQEQSFKGEIKLGVHKVALDSAKIYQIEVVGKGFMPTVILGNTMTQNSADFAKEPNVYRMMFSPPVKKDYSLIIQPGFSTSPQEKMDYSVTLKAFVVESKSLLQENKTLKDSDPEYKKEFQSRPHHQAIPIVLKKGTCYLIDMKVKKQAGFGGLDPYLILENPNAKIVAMDDDGGGFPNARITYFAKEDGEHRIIASGVGSAVGDFELIVRSASPAK